MKLRYPKVWDDINCNHDRLESLLWNFAIVSALAFVFREGWIGFGVHLFLLFISTLALYGYIQYRKNQYDNKDGEWK